MFRARQAENQSLNRVEHANIHGSLGIARDELYPCANIGDPSGFIVDLERELGRMRRYGDSSCLLMVTPDAHVDIKAMDSLGARFAANLRSYDSLCRYGANRFLVLLPNIQCVDVPGVIRRLRVQVVGYPLVLAGGENGFVTATTGGAILDTDRTMNENIDRAILACGVGLRQGGNTDHMWSPGLEAT